MIELVLAFLVMSPQTELWVNIERQRQKDDLEYGYMKAIQEANAIKEKMKLVPILVK